VDNSADLDDFEIDDDSHIPSTVTLLGQTRNRDVANLADLDDFEMDAGSALSPPLLTQTTTCDQGSSFRGQSARECEGA